MRRAHAWAGIVTLAIFIATGLYMRFVHSPPVAELDDATRALYRSRHLYLMLAALANLALAAADLNRRGDRVISVLALIAPPLLLAGFILEPESGVAEAGPFAPFGLYALFGAAALLALRYARSKTT